ncbi:MAG: hypothetical protein ACNA7W_05540 [Pseudomonadales bacterium]
MGKHWEIDTTGAQLPASLGEAIATEPMWLQAWVLIAWTPVYTWILLRRHRFDAGTAYGNYIRAYLVIAGISLIIDAADVLRYLAGDAELFMRWG